MKNSLLDKLLNILFQQKRIKDNDARFAFEPNLKSIQSIIKWYFNNRNYPSKTDWKMFLMLIAEIGEQIQTEVNIHLTIMEINTIWLDKYSIAIKPSQAEEMREFISRLING